MTQGSDPVSDGDRLDPAALLEAVRRQADQRRDLVALAAHELRNPLHAMALHLTLIRSMCKASGVDDIGARVARAQLTLSRYAERVTLLMELLSSAELQFPLNPVITDLAQRLDALVDSLEQDANSRGLALSFASEGRCVGLCDAMAVEQIVDNLLLNAFKHSAGTRVEVRLHCHDGRATVEVRDDGVGIPIEDQDRVFAKSVVATHGPRGAGSGLGLWIVTRLVNALGGTIKLTSSPQEGASFTVSFPLPNPDTPS